MAKSYSSNEDKHNRFFAVQAAVELVKLSMQYSDIRGDTKNLLKEVRENINPLADEIEAAINGKATHE